MGSARLGGELPLLVFLAMASLLTVRGRRDGRPIARILLEIGLCAWIAVLLTLTLFPLPLPPYDAGDGAGTSPWIEPVPLRTIGRAIAAGWSSPEARILVGNIAAFLPLGVLAPMLSPRWRSLWRTVALGFVVSLAIETAQLLVSRAVGFPWRVFDVDDLLLNTAGALIGYALWRIGWVAYSHVRPAVG